MPELSGVAVAASRRDDLRDLVEKRIETLRRKLLDTSRRNPLIATKLGSRSSSHVRVVDGLPDVLFQKLGAQRDNMRFVSLPALDDEPKDEQSREFQSALSEAMLTDEEWLVSTERIDQSSEESLDVYRKAERALKDRVRLQLGMPQRQNAGDTSLKQHAQINGISPSFDLPLPSEQHSDGRHQDNNIQTLLLPDDLERKMNGLITKCRTWIQETGIHVLYAAFGFLEWVDPRTNDASFAPLVLIPVDLEKTKTRNGLEFTVRGNGDDPETNTVLGEKLKQDFGIDLPQFSGDSLEPYFDEVASLSPKGLIWKVRRQVVVGVFPSARIAMYHDLDTSRNLSFNPAVIKLLGGTSSEVASVYGDEYEVDRPEIERKVRCLVLDADSSQFSTMVDVADGKDLAVEGPPGTGKSQTIVNTIASVLSEGKKVLFVAEKLAALDVVKSRLEAIGLGEFILPLQAERSTREQVVQSIRDRIDMTPGRVPAHLEYQLDRFRQTRADLQSYVDAISETVGSTGLTVFDVLGKSIQVNEFVDTLPKVLQSPHVDAVDQYNRSRIDKIKDVCNAVEAAWKDTRKAADLWRGLNVLNIDRFRVAEICDSALEAAGAIREEQAASRRLSELGIDNSEGSHNIELLQQSLAALRPLASDIDVDVLARLVDEPDHKSVCEFLDECQRIRQERADLSNIFAQPLNKDLADALGEIHSLCLSHAIDDLHVQRLNDEIVASESELIDLQSAYATIKPFVDNYAKSVSWNLVTFNKASAVVGATTSRVLLARRESLSDPSALEIVERSGKTGRRLQEKRDELETIFHLSRISVSAEGLASHVRVLRSAGWLAPLSGEFREAKKFYLSVTRRERFEKETALKDLTCLLDWKDDVADFVSDERAAAVFGSDFGLNADFGLFDELAQFYKNIDATLPGLEYRDVRNFLKTADADLIQAIPCVVTGFSGSVHELINQIQSIESNIAERRSTVADITKRCGIFRKPELVKSESLPELEERVRRFFDTSQSLEASEAIKPLIGKAFAGIYTDRQCLDRELQAVDVLRKYDGDRNIIIELIKTNKLIDACMAIDEYIRRSQSAASLLDRIASLTGISVTELKQREPNYHLADYLSLAAEDKDGLVAYSAYATALNELEKYGFGWLVSALLDDGRGIEELAFTFEAVLFRALARFVHGKHGAVLTRFTGRKLDECRERLARLDREIIELSRRQLRLQLFKRARPPGGMGVGRKSEWTDMALIENELTKKKGFISVRDLTHRAGKALLELKPCWMMSPLAVAQYLRKEQIVFDLVIIDEASQMPPEDALGALLRGRQVMVVGDTNQLPPTTFFRKLVDDDGVDQDEAVLEESILEMANAAFRPARRLRWHYRSRHSALINFSNQMVYNGDLIVFPSATEAREDMGVSLVSVNGRYSSGVNADEGKAMIQAALKFVREFPDRSLGLVVLNQKQRDLLLEEWEHVLTKHPAAARYVERWTERNDGLESFFIKNLENVQGDERDVIFIGTVCGPETVGGTVDHRSFGPINGLAGKRRLNVLFSRAKQQIVTFSSMKSADIRADENSNAGVYMLKKWLEYCAAGGNMYTGIQTNKSPDSDFEDYVINQIRSIGCEPVPQVGVAGYFIDIGVKHPQWPHGYIMGVECDGASYHSSRSARDRDRLRQEILERLGWHLHRIWSTDWFNDPRKQAERLREAVTLRVSELCGSYSVSSSGQNLVESENLQQVEVGYGHTDDEEDDESDCFENDHASTEEQNDSDDEDMADRRSPEDVSAAEITESILVVLRGCPNNSCTLNSLTKRVLKNLGVMTRGKPRMRFKKRVMQSVTNMVYKEVLERYRAKNERVRLSRA